MNVNNQMYRMFLEMKQGYINGDKNQMEHGARCWLQLNPVNPFEEESPEMEAFFQMQKCYNIWKRGDIDRKINGRRMIEWAEKLCALDPQQPYKFDRKADDEEKKKALEAQKPEEPQPVKTVVLEQPQVVLNVTPKVEVQEKKKWFKFIFPWRKEVEPNDGSRSN